jgi:hypothetical protein
VAYTSSLAERGVGQDCQPGDAALAPTAAALDGFDVGRYMAWIARQYNVSAAGENPGCCSGYGLPMMDAAVRVSFSCRYAYLYWAHEPNLFENRLHGVDLADLVTLVRQYGR